MSYVACVAHVQAGLSEALAKVAALELQVKDLQRDIAELDNEVEHERRLRFMAEGRAEEEKAKYQRLRHMRAW